MELNVNLPNPLEEAKTRLHVIKTRRKMKKIFTERAIAFEMERELRQNRDAANAPKQ